MLNAVGVVYGLCVKIQQNKDLFQPLEIQYSVPSSSEEGTVLCAIPLQFYR